MNFKKLQAMQEELDNAILAEKAEMTAEERFNQTLVSLDVEIAEIANCSEHFKFWKDNKGKVDEKRFYECKSPYFKEIYYFDRLGSNNEKLTRQQAHKLTLVEECSDALHFILSLANQLEVEIHSDFELETTNDELFLDLNAQIQHLRTTVNDDIFFKEANVTSLIDIFLSYTKNLGVTTEELEQAYYDKNEINYKRLREGY